MFFWNCVIVILVILIVVILKYVIWFFIFVYMIRDINNIILICLNNNIIYVFDIIGVFWCMLLWDK